MARVPEQLQTATMQAERLLAGGDPRAAKGLVEPVVRTAPGYSRAHTVLARALVQLGDTENALARFKAAAETAGGHPAPWQEFVMALIRAGQKGRARNVLKKAPLNGPDRKKLLDLARTGIPDTNPSLGGASEEDCRRIQEMIQSGRADDAEATAAELLKRHPQSAFLCNALGVIALYRGNPAIAETHFRDTLERSPGFSGAAGNLGLALTMQGKAGDAVRILRQAVADNPKSAETRTNLANALLKAGLLEDAVKEASTILDRDRNDPEALGIASSALMKLSRFDEAATLLERLDALPDSGADVKWQLLKCLASSNRIDEALAYARQNLDASPLMVHRYGTLLAELGHIDEAREAQAEAIRRDPQNSHAYMAYGAIRKWTADDPVLGQLENLVRQEDFHDDKGAAHYALAKARMDMGADDDVFGLLHKANAFHAASTEERFEPAENDRIIRGLIETWSAEQIGRLKAAGVATNAPIFVIGMPRSGSTLVERIIASHSRVVGIGEDSLVSPLFPIEIPADRTRISDAAREGAERLRNAAPGGLRVADKYLNNFWRVGALAAAFPRAIFVDTVRDPRSIALSIYSNAMKVDGHPYSTDLAHIAHYYLGCVRLMKHWKDILGDRFVSVTYENLVSDPEPCIRDLIARLGLPWEDACLRPEELGDRVRTLSVGQVRSRIGTGSKERWKRYEDDLAPFTQVLRAAGAI